jgi:nicotinamide mononucleotide adenylyltransferase
MSRDIAVWDGRFQPLHKGHVAVMEAIVRQFATDLVVMIIQSSEGSRSEYGKEVDRHHKLSRNPLTFWERFQLIRLALKGSKFAANIEVLGIPRPDLHWDIARNFYPDRRFICLTGKDEYERRKEHFWAGLGERVRVVDIRDVPRVSATNFKAALKRGRDFERFLPDNCIEYFRSIDGPARFMSADI